jgi:hypothetical protein
VPLHPCLKPILDLTRERRRSPFIIGNLSNGPLWTSGLLRIIDQPMRRVGVKRPGLGGHAFRRAFNDTLRRNARHYDLERRLILGTQFGDKHWAGAADTSQVMCSHFGGRVYESPRSGWQQGGSGPLKLKLAPRLGGAEPLPVRKDVADAADGRRAGGHARCVLVTGQPGGTGQLQRQPVGHAGLLGKAIVAAGGD